jgi:hypothetical protein
MPKPDEANLFDIKRKPKRAASAPLPFGAVQRLIDVWIGLFEAKFREKPVLTKADAAPLRRLAVSHGVALVERRLPRYLALADPLYRDEGYPLRLLPRAWGRLMVDEAASPSRVPDAEQTSDYLRKLKER